MKRFCFRLVAALSWIWTCVLHAEDKRIRVRADIWCPYNCDPSSPGKKGSMIDIMKLALEPAGYTLDYDVMSWEESLKAARSGEIEAVVGLTMADAEGFRLPAQPQGMGVTCFYGKRGGALDQDGFRLNKIEQLLSKRVVVPRGYTFLSPLQTHIDTYKDDASKIVWVESSWPLVDAYRAVFREQADLFPENEAVINYLLRSLGIRGGGQIKSLGCLEGEKLFVGFSEKRADAAELAELVSKKLDELRKSGELDRVLAKYEQKDWVKTRP